MYATTALGTIDGKDIVSYEISAVPPQHYETSNAHMGCQLTHGSQMLDQYQSKMRTL